MVQLSLAFVALVAASAQASPIFQKRIAQVIADSTTKWEQACDNAGGGLKCNPLAVSAFETLLAAAGPCDQQNAADNMIDLAKTLKSQDMITLAQIFAQQPRNTPNSLAVPYCQQAPQNVELTGLFQCQFQGANLEEFVGGSQVGSPGTIPLNMNKPVNPPGSCPGHPAGPIPAGSQLSDITTNPNAPNGSGAPAAAPPATSPAAAPPVPMPSATSTPANTPSAANFALPNGQAAQKLNAQFASLTSTSPCTNGDEACVKGDFAQCVGGKFVTQSCGLTLTCAAVPLVKFPGTSITCTTPADAQQRISNTGVRGGLTGS
jgi:hypothetical protein